MLTRIIDLIAATFGQRLEARLAEETAMRLNGFAARVEAALNDGDVTPEALVAVAAVEDKKKRSKA